jgi:hypothetical protein
LMQSTSMQHQHGCNSGGDPEFNKHNKKNRVIRALTVNEPYETSSPNVNSLVQSSFSSIEPDKVASPVKLRSKSLKSQSIYNNLINSTGASAANTSKLSTINSNNNNNISSKAAATAAGETSLFSASSYLTATPITGSAANQHFRPVSENFDLNLNERDLYHTRSVIMYDNNCLNLNLRYSSYGLNDYSDRGVGGSNDNDMLLTAAESSMSAIEALNSTCSSNSHLENQNSCSPMSSESCMNVKESLGEDQTLNNDEFNMDKQELLQQSDQEFTNITNNNNINTINIISSSSSSSPYNDDVSSLSINEQRIIILE